MTMVLTVFTSSTFSMCSFLLATALLVCVFHLGATSCDPTCPDCPCFSQQAYTITIPDNVPSGTTVQSLTASSPLSLPLTYSLTGSTHFSVDANSGALMTTVNLNYATVSSYTLTVRASDMMRNLGIASVTVNLLRTSVVGNLLICTSTVMNFQVLEGDIGVQHSLPTCFNSDGSIVASTDLSHTISSGNIGSLFAITASSQVSNVSPLDYESQTIHVLQVDLSNSETPSRATTISVIVTVAPANEFPPTFNSDPIDITVSEAATIGSVIGRVSATDQDTGADGLITYTVNQSLDQSNIIIDPTSGQIILIDFLDYESLQMFSFTVMAADNPSDPSTRMSTTATLNLYVQDANDNPPIFARAAYATRVPENMAIMSEVMTLTCDDVDTQVNSDVTYSIVDGNSDNKFSIDSTTGRISLENRIDYDDPTSTILYTLRVTCEEVRTPRRTAETLAVIEVTSVNEFRPDPGSTYRRVIREDTAPGTVIVQVQGRDRDRGPAGVLEYRLVPPNGAMFTYLCPNNFYIHIKTGTVYLVSPLDFEQGLENYHCVVSVRDSQTPIQITEQDIFIQIQNVNDARPTCDPLLYRLDVPENHTVGSNILSLSCTDSDSPNLQYSFLDQSVSMFRVNQQGVIALNEQLDFETQMVHILHVEVSDGQYSINASVYLTVTGSNENAPVYSTIPVCSVTENSIQGTSVCTVRATDGDNGDDGVVNFAITNTGIPFDIQPDSGLIYVTDDLDADTVNEYILQIRAYDNGIPSLTNDLTLTVRVMDINDNSPQMNSNIYATVPENSQPGMLVMHLSCTDADSDSANSDALLQIASIVQDLGDGNLSPVNSVVFAINGSTGELTTVAMLDFEVVQHYMISMICRDQGLPSLATSSTVHIQVSPQNEYSPIVSQATYAATIPESVELGSSVLTVSASDADAGVQGEISYSIDPSARTNTPFWIHPQTGVLSVVKQPRCHIETAYLFQVIVSDRGTPSLETRANVSVTIDQCHLGTLTSSLSVYITDMTENTVAGETALTVSCMSSRMPGVSPNYRLTQSSDYFEVDAITGDVRVLIPPDYEQFITHLLHIRCFDPNNQGIFADMTAHISILPVNEHTPNFEENIYHLRISENTQLGTRIGVVRAVDADGGRDGDITYFISQGSDVALLDPMSGEIFLTRDLDRETQDRVTITVVARDNPSIESMTHSSTAQVQVQVTDYNDNWPVCNKTVFHINISPLTEITSIILSDLGCSDGDVGSNSQLQYSLGDGTNKFSIDSLTGALSLIGLLDPEDAVAYHVPVLIVDGGNPPLSITVLVIIDLRQPPPEIEEGGGVDQEYISLVEAEGLKNSVTIVLDDFSKDIWEKSMDAKDNFNEVVARSVTSHCAIYPEACSLIYGCAQFFGFTLNTSNRKRSTRSVDQTSNYANFIQPHVVVLPNLTSELKPSSPERPTSSSRSVTSLRINFYVKLPDQAHRSPTRATNYVVPKTTLNQIVSHDQSVISAVVRNTVSPSLTESILNIWKVVAIVFVVIFSLVITIILMIIAIYGVYKFKEQSNNRVVPFRTPKASASSSNTSASSSSTKAVIELTSIQSHINGREQCKPSTLSHFLSSNRCLPHNMQVSQDSGTSRRSSSNSSCLTNASMENQVSQGGSTSPRRISSGDVGHLHGSGEEMRILECEERLEEEEEDSLGTFPITRPRNQIKAPAMSRWSMHGY